MRQTKSARPQPTPDRPLRLVAGPQPPAGVSPSFQDVVAATDERQRAHDEKRARAKTLLQELNFKAELYPEFAAHLEPAISALKNELRRGPMSDRGRVLRVLESYESLTFDDLADETALSLGDLAAILISLVTFKLVECRTSGIRRGVRMAPPFAKLLAEIETFTGHKLARDTELLFVLTHTPAFSGGSQPEQSTTKNFMDSMDSLAG